MQKIYFHLAFEKRMHIKFIFTFLAYNVTIWYSKARLSKSEKFSSFWCVSKNKKIK